MGAGCAHALFNNQTHDAKSGKWYYNMLDAVIKGLFLGGGVLLVLEALEPENQMKSRRGA